MKQTIIYDILVFTSVLLILVFVKIPYINILLAFLIIMIYSYKDEGLKISLGFSKPKNLIKLFTKAVLFAIGIVIIGYFILLDPIEKLIDTKLQLGVFSQLNGNFSLYFTSIIIGWIVGGLFEEVIFRGFMISKFIKYLGEKTGAIVGIVFPSVLFGYLHAYQGVTGQILTGLIGIILASIYVLNKRNLWLNILTHGFVNTIIMTLLYIGLTK